MPSLAWLNQAPFAHRGLHGGAAGLPENSLAAFRAAMDAGYAIELDTRLAADGVPVVFHDATLERMAGLKGRIASRSSAELALTRLGESDEGIPRLAEVLDLVAGETALLVEVKNSRHRLGALEAAVWRLLKGYQGRCAVLSFNPSSLAWFRHHAPALIRGQNIDRPVAGFSRPAPSTSSRPHFISHNVGALDYRIAARIRARGLPLIAWTVRTEAERAKALRYADNYMFEELRP